MKNSLLIALMGFTLFVAGCGQPPSGGGTTGTTTTTSSTTTTTDKSMTPSATATESGGTSETVTMTEVNIQYTLPAGWKKDADGNLTTENEDLAVFFVPTEAENVEAAGKAIGEELGKVLQNVKVDRESSEKNASGLEMQSIEGTAEHEGKPVRWSVDIMQSNGAKPLIVLEFAEADAYEKHQKDYGEFANSFAPIQGAGDMTPSDNGSPDENGGEPGDDASSSDASPDAGGDTDAQ